MTMITKLTEKTVKVYTRNEEIVEVESRDDNYFDFWYTRRLYGKKLYVFGIKITDSEIEENLDIAFAQGRGMWENEGIR